MSVLVPSATGVIQGDFLSAPRLNRMLIHVLKGSEMPTYNPKYDGMKVICSEDGNTFVRMTEYVWDAVLGQYKGSSGGRHKHNEDTEAAGGLFAEILRANIAKYLALQAVALGDLAIVQSGSASGAAEPGSGRGIRLQTGGTNASTINGSQGGVGLDLARPAEFSLKGFVDANTFISARMGCAMESIADGPSDLAKFGLEGCSSTSTGANWDVISATGALSSRSVNVSAETLLRAAPRNYKLVFTPGQSVTFSVDGSVPIVTKISSIPAGGRTSGVNTLTTGIKTNNTTPKSFYVYMARLIGSINDLSWF